MPRISHEAEEELHRLRTQQAALDTAISRMLAFEAAMRVLTKHGLMPEFASEIVSLTNGNGKGAT